MSCRGGRTLKKTDLSVTAENESYAANSLGDTQSTSPEEKILGVCRNFDTDNLTRQREVKPLLLQSVDRQAIPRLELLAVLLLARLITNVFNAFEPEVSLGRSSCFTDSNTGSHLQTRSGASSEQSEPDHKSSSSGSLGPLPWYWEPCRHTLEGYESFSATQWCCIAVRTRRTRGAAPKYTNTG